jgi:hypothetical protein
VFGTFETIIEAEDHVHDVQAIEGTVGQGYILGEHTERKMPKDRMLQFFAYEHLPEHLRRVSAPFGELAKLMVETLPSNPERTAGLRKLLEAKDCAVRAVLFKED